VRLTWGAPRVILGGVVDLYKQFGSELRAARDGSDLTQEQVAGRVGLTRTSITNIEAGRQQVSLHQLYQLAAAVGKRPAELLPDLDGGVDAMLSEPISKRLESDADGLAFAARLIRSIDGRAIRESADE
jgi:transcriptional regulator with XRE-family HTH domain